MRDGVRWDRAGVVVAGGGAGLDLTVTAVRARQPGASLARLQATHRPCPLPAVVGPLVGVPGGVVHVADRGVAPGVRQVWSRVIRNRRSPPVKVRRAESIATRACSGGRV